MLLLSTYECCARSPLVPRWTADAFSPSCGHPSLAVMPGSCALPTPPCRLSAAAALACAAAALPSRRALCSSRGRVSRSVVRFRRVSYTFGTRDGDTAPHAPADGRSSFNSLGRSLPALPLGARVCGRAARQRAQGGAADERAAGARAAGGESAIAWSRGASLMRRCWTYAESRRWGRDGVSRTSFAQPLFDQPLSQPRCEVWTRRVDEESISLILSTRGFPTRGFPYFTRGLPYPRSSLPTRVFPIPTRGLFPTAVYPYPRSPYPYPAVPSPYSRSSSLQIDELALQIGELDPFSDAAAIFQAFSVRCCCLARTTGTST